MGWLLVRTSQLNPLLVIKFRYWRICGWTCLDTMCAGAERLSGLKCNDENIWNTSCQKRHLLRENTVLKGPQHGSGQKGASFVNAIQLFKRYNSIQDGLYIKTIFMDLLHSAWHRLIHRWYQRSYLPAPQKARPLLHALVHVQTSPDHQEPIPHRLPQWTYPIRQVRPRIIEPDEQTEHQYRTKVLNSANAVVSIVLRQQA